MKGFESENRASSKNPAKILLTAAELTLMAGIILFDILIPSILVAATGVLFVLIRKEKMPITAQPAKYGKLKFAGIMFMFAVVWSGVEFGLIMPIQNHLLHDTRNVDSFAAIEGNLPKLMLFLLAGWVLAAVGEEFAFRGFFQNRIISLFPCKQLGTIAAVVITAVFFGLIHIEQGVIGFVVTAIDGTFFSIVRYRYKSIWASVLVHGFMNSIGFITFYFTGPVYGLW